MREAFSKTSSTAARATWRAAVGLLALLRLELALHRRGRCRAPARAPWPSESGMPVEPPLGRRSSTASSRSAASSIVDARVGLPPGPLGRGADHAGGDLVGDRRGDPVDELVALVDDEHVVLGQHLAALEGVDRHERVVGDDDVDVRGGLAGALDEALGHHRAAGCPGTPRRDTDTWRQARSDTPGHQLVAVAGLGDLGPVAQPHHLGAEPRGLLVDRADRHSASRRRRGSRPRACGRTGSCAAP